MYLKKNYVEQVPEFLEQIRKNKGNYTYDKKTGGNIDTRPRLRTKIPFSGFIDPLVFFVKNHFIRNKSFWSYFKNKKKIFLKKKRIQTPATQ